jgi:hypothetical protein
MPGKVPSAFGAAINERMAPWAAGRSTDSVLMIIEREANKEVGGGFVSVWSDETNPVD